MPQPGSCDMVLNKLSEVESQTQEIERWLPRSRQGREGGKEVSVHIRFQFCKMKEFQRSLYSCQHNTAQLCFKEVKLEFFLKITSLAVAGGICYNLSTERKR